MKRQTWVGSAVVLVVVAGAVLFTVRGGKEEIKWRTAKVDRGNVTQKITATGALNALIQVPVGTQVSGVVVSLSADFNSLVKKGQVIGQIDPTPWLTALRDAQANLQRNQASLAFAQADYKRNLELWKNKLLDDADLDTKHLALQTAQGNLVSAQATLATARTNLGYCTIKAPVDGVVVARLVDVGQTVAASFSTPNVFTIAQDLSKMKVVASIDEADVGQVKVGQRAFFTVDSYPDKQFRGQVSEVQLNPVITNNVVTYNVVMEVDNQPRSAYLPAQQGGGSAQRQPSAGAGRRPFRPGGPSAAKSGGGLGQPQAGTLEYTTARYMPPGSPVYRGDYALFPGMTANCSIVTNRKEDTLRVPSAALRFNPAAFITMDDRKGAPAPAQGGTQRPAGGSGSGAGGNAPRREDRLWVLADGKPKAIPVRAGVSDGMFTEISGEGVGEGLVVLTGVDDFKKALPTQAAPPFGGGMRH